MARKGYEKLKADVMCDCERGCRCFSEQGCNVERQRIGNYGEDGYKSCCHSFCDKFKWIIDRAQHYADKTGSTLDDVLDAWEDNRNYWYMNYYQECNQPLASDRHVKIFENVDGFKPIAWEDSNEHYAVQE